MPVKYLLFVLFFTVLAYCSEWTYHNNAQLEFFLKNFTKSTKGAVRASLYSIGKTRSSKDLWAVELTATKRKKIGIPNIKLIGTVHGNSPVGRELLLHFMEFLRDNYVKNLEVTWLLDNARIHFVPNLNPDGFDLARENNCDGQIGRYLGKSGKDLYRNFPDYFHKNPIPEEPETKAIKKWMSDVPFVLSAAFYGGATVVNYPFDTVEELPSDSTHMPSLTPDSDVFRHLAQTYVRHHLTNLDKNRTCKNSRFEDGITNGADWNIVIGGMQDYNYAFHGCMELTLFISCCKYPKAAELPRLWEENQMALLKFCLEGLKGVTGQIIDALTLKPVAASLKITGRDMGFRSFQTGEFWRVLLPGSYELEVSAAGYYKQTVPFIVKSCNNSTPEMTVLKVALMNSTFSTTTEQSSSASVQEFSERNVDAAFVGVSSFNEEKPSAARLIKIGKENACIKHKTDLFLSVMLLLSILCF